MDLYTRKFLMLNYVVYYVQTFGSLEMPDSSLFEIFDVQTERPIEKRLKKVRA